MNSAEIMKNAVDEFKKIQKYMIIAKEEQPLCGGCSSNIQYFSNL